MPPQSCVGMPRRQQHNGCRIGSYRQFLLLVHGGMVRLNRKITCLAALCLVILLCLLLLMHSGLSPSDVQDTQFAWLRRSRDARLYVRPKTRTVLLEPTQPCDSSHRLLLLVTSATGHTEHRQAVRDTWGQRHPQAKLVFFLGHGGSTIEPMVSILTESQQHGDLVVEDFVDTYHNLTLKTMFMLKWAQHHCTSVPFVLKTDDDMLINTRGLLRQLTQWGDGSRPLVTGWRYHNVEPYRDSTSKWYVPPWLYPRDRFPDFVSGTAYLMTRVALEELYVTALDTPLMPLEDVFLTGIVASDRLGLPIEDLPRFRKDRPSRLEHPCLYHHLLTAHELPPQQLKRIWSSLIDLKPKKCDSLYVWILANMFGTGHFQVIMNDPW